MMAARRTRTASLRSSPDGGERGGVVWSGVRPERVRDKHARCEARQWRARPGGRQQCHCEHPLSAGLGRRGAHLATPSLQPLRSAGHCQACPGIPLAAPNIVRQHFGVCPKPPPPAAPRALAVRECPPDLQQPLRAGGESGMAFAGLRWLRSRLAAQHAGEGLASALVAGIGGSFASETMRAPRPVADRVPSQGGQALTEKLATQEMK